LAVATLTPFSGRFPQYRISLRASLDIQDLRQGLVDIGVRMGQGGWEGLQQQHLFDDELVVVAAPDFRQGKLPRTPAEIVAGPVVRTVESWMGWCQAWVEEPSQAGLWINDSNLVLQAVSKVWGWRWSGAAWWMPDLSPACWAGVILWCPIPIRTGWCGRSAKAPCSSSAILLAGWQRSGRVSGGVGTDCPAELKSVADAEAKGKQ
jgi:DNA-binding transcriptional LysR family regulator